MDKARKKTDKMLKNLERRVRVVYDSDPALRRIQEKYNKYMAKVEKATHEQYVAYQRATDPDERNELKRVYADAVEALTLRNKAYKALVREFTKVIADVNQKALDVINQEMPEIYVENYNQIAVDCEKAGITVE